MRGSARHAANIPVRGLREAADSIENHASGMHPEL